jgi:hypothetical protein
MPRKVKIYVFFCFQQGQGYDKIPDSTCLDIMKEVINKITD